MLREFYLEIRGFQQYINALKDNDPTNDDMIKTGNDDESQTTDNRRLNFTYYRTLSKYIYNPIHNE